MPNLTKLVVEYYGVKTESILPVTALVWASPRLQECKLVVGALIYLIFSCLHALFFCRIRGHNIYISISVFW